MNLFCILSPLKTAMRTSSEKGAAMPVIRLPMPNFHGNPVHS